MTATAPPVTACRHPLSPLTAGEIDEVRDLVAGTLTGTTRYVYVGLEEPDKAEVLGWSPGTDVEPGDVQWTGPPRADRRIPAKTAKRRSGGESDQPG